MSTRLLSNEQKELLEALDRFLMKVFPPSDVRKKDAEHADCSYLVPAFGEVGILALPFPTEYGGLEAQPSTVLLVSERLGRHAAIAAALYSMTVDFGGMTILHAGTATHKQELLPRLIEGGVKFALAVSEPGAGSDIRAISTKAERTRAGWRLNGRKSWISCADTADYLITLCRTSGNAEDKKRFSLFMVPRGSQGVHMTRLNKAGNNCMSSWDIGFSDVKITDASLVGEDGGGLAVVGKVLEHSRVNQAAQAVGQAQRAVDLTIAHTKERKQFGRRIADFQSIRHSIVDMQLRVDQARLMVYAAGQHKDLGLHAGRQVAQAKVVASETLRYVADRALHITASQGYSSESDIQRIWRDSGLYTFGEGTNELHRDYLARELGL